MIGMHQVLLSAVSINTATTAVTQNHLMIIQLTVTVKHTNKTTATLAKLIILNAISANTALQRNKQHKSAQMTGQLYQQMQ